MNKKIWILILAAVLALATATAAILLPQKPLPPVTTLPSDNGYVSPDQPTLPPEAPGAVRIFTCDEQLAPILSQLAVRYFRLTGIQVSVIAVDSGSCQQALEMEMAKDKAPTIFCIHSQDELLKWQDTLQELSRQDVFENLYAPEFALQVDGRPLALSMDVGGYGLVYNAQKLAEAGFTRSDIVDFASLANTVRHITSQKPGFTAFAFPDLSDASHQGLACMLLGLNRNIQDLRQFWDLYIQHAAKKGSLDSFLQGDSVFRMGATWEYDALSGLGAHSLDILPAFSSDSGGLQCVTQVAWGVNKNGYWPDVAESMKFLAWLTTADAVGQTPVDELGLLSPFRDAKWTGNYLEKQLRKYMKSETMVVSWQCEAGISEEMLRDLSNALEAYRLQPTDQNWADVEDVLS